MNVSLLAFSVTKNNKYTLVMGDKVYETLKSLNRDEIYTGAKENDLIILYLRKLVSVYGQFDIDILYKYLKEYENIDAYDDQYVYLFNYDKLFSELYHMNDGIIKSTLIAEMEDLEFREKYKDLDYYPLSKEEFYNDSISDNEMKLSNYLKSTFGYDDDFINNFIENIKEGIQCGMSIKELNAEIAIFKKEKETYRIFKDFINSLYENTRLFSLKEHTLT